MEFRLQAPFEPAGDQPQAIQQLVDGLRNGRREQVLMGVTGSGKTFTMANVIQQLQRPALVLSHNKTLAAQLYSEFKEFFPHNAVSYFVSYYDYYQPEAYIPQRDIYIEKDASINEEIDRLRLATTSSLVSRRDVIVVASVSCIYGLGSPEDYKAMMVGAARWATCSTATTMLAKLVDIQYERNDTDPSRGKFRVRGDSRRDLADATRSSPTASSSGATRSSGCRSSIRRQRRSDRQAGADVTSTRPSTSCCRRSGSHNAVDAIRKELRERLELFKRQGKLLEAQRLNARTRFDIEMMMEVGYCPGIENYSRPLSGRKPGEPPYTLFDFFPEGLPAVRRRVARHGAAGRGDVRRRPQPQGDARRARLPAAERARQPAAASSRSGEQRINQVVYVSATPGPYELEQTGGEVVEQVMRPTGLLRPGDRGRAGPRAGAALAGADSRAGGGRRARAGDDAHQAAGRGPGGLFRRARRAVQVAAQRAGCVRARGAAARSAARAVRGAGGREPAARRARPARSVAGGDSRRRQGRLPAERDVADADDRPGGPQRERQGDSVRRQGDRLDAAGDRRDGAPPQAAGGVQHASTASRRRRSRRRSTPASSPRRRPTPRRTPRSAAPTRREYITEEYIAELEAEMYAAAEAMEFERAAAIRDRIGQMREAVGRPVESVGERGSAGSQAARAAWRRKRRRAIRPRGRAACRGRSGAREAIDAKYFRSFVKGIGGKSLTGQDSAPDNRDSLPYQRLATHSRLLAVVGGHLGMRVVRVAALFGFCCACANSAFAAINYSSLGSTYSEDFDVAVPPASGTTAWSNDSTFAGWSLFRINSPATPTPYVAITTYETDDGVANTSRFYSYGVSGNTECALGAVGGSFFGDANSTTAAVGAGVVVGWIASECH